MNSRLTQSNSGHSQHPVILHFMHKKPATLAISCVMYPYRECSWDFTQINGSKVQKENATEANLCR